MPIQKLFVHEPMKKDPKLFAPTRDKYPYFGRLWWLLVESSQLKLFKVLYTHWNGESQLVIILHILAYYDVLMLTYVFIKYKNTLLKNTAFFINMNKYIHKIGRAEGQIRSYLLLTAQKFGLEGGQKESHRWDHKKL